MNRFLISLTFVVFVNCAYYANYSVSQISPPQQRGNNYDFEDSVIAVIWLINTNGIDFELKNKSNSIISVLWDDGAIVDYNGTSQSVVDKEAFLKGKNKYRPKRTVPPNSTINGSYIPLDRVSYGVAIPEFFPKYKSWSLNETEQKAKVFLDRDFSVLLPVEINDKKKNYYFTFKINQIRLHTLNRFSYEDPLVKVIE